MKAVKRYAWGRAREIVAVSGGPDSVYLLVRFADRGMDILSAHFNHKARGPDSERDRRFVERMCKDIGIPLKVGSVRETASGESRRVAGDPLKQAGFEDKARRQRRAFLKKVMADSGAVKILMAHTADDQVETVLMRLLEGAGISGLKGIPRSTGDGVERPLLDTWRDEIVEYLGKHGIPYRVDKSNFDTRFERNWIRHVLIPMLEKRYGKSVKKRIFALGERFREIDEFLDSAARGWMKRNVKKAGDRSGERAGLRLRRGPFGKLPSALRMKILQIACFERIGISPNERLLESMDRLVASGNPSAFLDVGGGAVLRNRYAESILEPKEPGGRTRRKTERMKHWQSPVIKTEAKVKISAAALKAMTEGENAAVFDADALAVPVAIRPLAAGDRIRPFGLDAEKKVKEILIDRKVPRSERWGRPVVCDARGEILWIPGVVRSAHAPVAPATRRTVILRFLQATVKPA